MSLHLIIAVNTGGRGEWPQGVNPTRYGRTFVRSFVRSFARSLIRSLVRSFVRSLARIWGKFRFTLRDRHYSTQPATTFYSLQHAANLCFPLSSSAEINARRAPKLFVRHPPCVRSRTYKHTRVHAISARQRASQLFTLASAFDVRVFAFFPSICLFFPSPLLVSPPFSYGGITTGTRYARVASIKPAKRRDTPSNAR